MVVHRVKDVNLDHSVYPNGHTKSYAYNALNEETSVTNADGDTESFTYDHDGNVLTDTDGLDHTTTYSYSVTDQVLTEQQPSGGGTTKYSYDHAEFQPRSVQQHSPVRTCAHCAENAPR